MNTTTLQFSRRKKITPLLQSEAAECGLACLGMMLNYFGGNTDVSSLRRKFTISMKGSTMADILTMVEHMGMTGRGLRLELDELDQLQIPCILHWELSHFVILERVRGKKVTVIDPAQGRMTYNFDEVSKRFTGLALEVLPTVDFQPPKKESMLRLSDFWSVISGLKSFLIHLFALTMVLQLFGLASPYTMQIITDQVIASNDVNMLNVVIVGFSLLMVLEIFTGWLRSFIGQRLSHQLTFQMDSNLLYHLLSVPLNYFEKRHLGDILSRMGSLSPIQQLISVGLAGTILDGLMAIITFTVLMLYAPILVFVIFVALLGHTLLNIAMYPRLKYLAQESLVTDAKLNSNLMETLRSMQAIKLYGRESQRHALWQNLNVANMNLGIKSERLGFWQSNLNSLIFGTERLILLYIGAKMVISEQMTLGMLMAFLAYREQFVSRVGALIDFVFDFHMLKIHLDRLADIVLTAREINYKQEKKCTLNEIQGKIELKNICFKYADFEKNIFDNFSLLIYPGESVALVGSSGVGKSTLIKLMMGLLKANKGQIFIDDKSIEECNIQDFRSQVATVMQNEQLLSGTIAENIHFFSEEPDQGFIEQCAIYAKLHEDIIKMPMGYHTLIGEMGSTLSGGQKQRLVLARALYKRPKILFMDEATSHLDVDLEKNISQAIQSLNMTRVLIAHRPETIASAGRVIQL